MLTVLSFGRWVCSLLFAYRHGEDPAAPFKYFQPLFQRAESGFLLSFLARESGAQNVGSAELGDTGSPTRGLCRGLSAATRPPALEIVSRFRPETIGVVPDTLKFRTKRGCRPAAFTPAQIKRLKHACPLPRTLYKNSRFACQRETPFIFSKCLPMKRHCEDIMLEALSVSVNPMPQTISILSCMLFLRFKSATMPPVLGS